MYFLGPPSNSPINIRFPVGDITGESFVVQWDIVDDNFDVTYMMTWTDGIISGTINTTITSYTVGGLDSNTTYSVTVTAINTCCGAGPVSDAVNVTTNLRPATTPIVNPTCAGMSMYLTAQCGSLLWG